MIRFVQLLVLLFTGAATGLYGQNFSVSPAQLNFGIVTEVTPDSQQVTISNTTLYDITVTGYRFYNFYGAPAFSTTGGVFMVPAGSSQSIWIKFSPVHNINHNSELFILSDCHCGALRVDLLGQGRYSKSYYNNTENLIEEVLKDSLHDIIGRNYFNAGYSIARDSMFMSYDNLKVNGGGTSSNTIECVYTGRQAVGYTDRTDCQTNYSFNTEHTFPQNFFNSLEPMRADLYHLFPTDDLANNTRGSLPFGVVNNPTWSQGGSKGNSSTFEPRDVHKGATARAMFYFVVRYQNYSNFLTSQEGILRQWHDQFPPTAAEITRGNKIFQLQDNRNPFIDYPQFIDRITSISNTSVGNVATSTDTPTDTIDFGIVPGNAANNYTFWIMNDGNAPLNISGLNMNVPASLFFINGTDADTTILPGEAAGIDIVLTMVSPGPFTANLNFTAQGTGLLANVSVPIIANVSWTGLTEVSNGNGYTIYPNPASGHICINPNPTEGTVKIYDLEGRMLQEQGQVSSGCLPVSDIVTPGVYLLEWTGEQGRVYREKWVKTFNF